MPGPTVVLITPQPDPETGETPVVRAYVETFSEMFGWTAATALSINGPHKLTVGPRQRVTLEA